MMNPGNFGSYDMMGFGGFGAMHWLMFALIVTVIAYPVGLILKKLGHSPLWAALTFIPLVNIVGLWVLAVSKRRSAEV